MQINDLTRHYNQHTTSSAETMTGAKGIERLVSSVREMAAGNIFEGTVNSVKNGQVVLGLSNGNELLARLDAAMNIEAGQSMFFQVKSNDGNTIAIRPYTVDGAGANLTLVNALKAANLSISDKFLNMANTMMQEQMPIDKNSLSQMARILMANPDMNVQTLVQMKKLNIPITEQMVAQFENYMDDQSAVHSAIDRFVDQLPQALTNDTMSAEQLKAFDGQFLSVLADGMEGLAQTNGEALANSVSVETSQQVMQGNGTVLENIVITENGVSSEAAMTVENGMSLEAGVATEDVRLQENDVMTENGVPIESGAVTENGVALENAKITESGKTLEQAVQQEGILDNKIVQGNDMTSNTVQSALGETMTAEKQVAQEESVNTQKQLQNEDVFGKLSDKQKEQLLGALKQHLGEFEVSKDDSAFSLLNKISKQLESGEGITKANVKELFSDKNVQNFLKEVLEQQLLLKPKEAGDGDKVKELYKHLEGKMERLDVLMQNAGMKDTPIAQTLTDIRGNVDFMNQMNQAFTYVQIPLKMSNQNATAQLYVYTNKKDLADPERDLTAFLHLDLEHLGATDVSVRMHRKEVKTKFYMDSDEAYELVKVHMPELEERLRQKGYNCTIEIENEGKKVNFVQDFLKKDTPSTGQLHRYSFDMRA